MGYAKIKAHEVTDGDGLMKCEWRRLITGEHVLGWRCHSQDGKTCIYGVVDLRSWPIVIGQNGRKGEPRLAIVVNGS